MEFTSYLQQISAPFSVSPLVPKSRLPFTVLILSPHPDDECIVGSLPLRLQQENNATLINVAVTLGSKVERRKARLQELQAATGKLDMELDILSDDWTKKARELKALIQKYQPQLILAPHVKDHHPTHIKTGKLLMKLLKTIKTPTLIAWSEFWGAMEKPNLLIEVPLEILEQQMSALALHTGEVKRNPYHLRLPGWMLDNVRRGGEVITNTGGDVPAFAFGVIYKLELYKAGKARQPELPSPFLSSFADLGQIFNEILEAASGSKTKTK